MRGYGKCRFCAYDHGPIAPKQEECIKCKKHSNFVLNSRITPMMLAEYTLFCEREDWANDKSEHFDRDTALMVLKALTTFMRPGRDIFGEPTLVIRRDNFELVRKKFLD